MGFQGEGASSSQSLPLPMLLTVVYGLEELQNKDDTRNRGLVRFSYNPSFSAYFFSRNSVFSHNKSAETVFWLVFSAKQTGLKRHNRL